MANLSMEIEHSIREFMRAFSIDVSPRELREFLARDQITRSLMRLPQDCIGAIAELLNPTSIISLMCVCRSIHDRWRDKWRCRVVSHRFPRHIFSQWDSADDRWRQMCLDWVAREFNFLDDQNVKSCKSVKKIENTIIRLRNELEDIKKYKTASPTQQTRLAEITHNKQILAEETRLKFAWEWAPPEISKLYALISWMLPSRYITNIPEPDERLYGGIPRSDYLDGDYEESSAHGYDYGYPEA